MALTTAPVAQRVRAVLRDRIERGEWPAGMALPSEAALCREFGTSRGPVRRALSGLRADGYVVGGRGRPPVVGRVVPSQSLAEFRSFTEWARAEGKTPGTRTLVLERRAAASSVAGLLELDEGAVVVDLVRVRLLDDVPIMIERASFVPDVGRYLFGIDTDTCSVSAELARHGVPLVSARHTIDAVSANRLDAEALGIAAGAPLLRERRLSKDASGRPLEHAEARYRSEFAAFRVDNRVPGASPIEVRAS
ncbi:GntR family transcriptional regulator [Agromyces protaetiae]|uniref:GntR family transcriptional regulator n=1 Tax=Agromyces protaetiae TaxID=2509455 RepID=A0A4P6FAS0_9MICO|nr:GntR family transcriptional regulator [Agromyces protaetiae]QAY72904.1 GntR family transcriptional regulator [Agromyces protaetiae]